MMKKTVAMMLTSMVLAGPALVGPALAEEPSKQAIVDQRVEMLKTLGGAMKALSAAAKGDKPMSEVSEAADVVATIGDKLVTLFPEGTAKGDDGVTDSRALPEIWQNKDKFNALFAGVGEGGQAAQAAVAAGDQAALGAALGQAGKNCKACHDEFRGKKNFLF